MSEFINNYLEKAYNESYTTGNKILEMEGILAEAEIMAIKKEFPLIEILGHTNINRTVFYLAPRKGSFKHIPLLLSFIVGYLREELPLALQSNIIIERVTSSKARGLEFHFCSLEGDYQLTKVLSKHRITLYFEVVDEFNVSLEVRNKISSLRPLKEVSNQPLDKVLKPIVEYFFTHEQTLLNLLENPRKTS